MVINDGYYLVINDGYYSIERKKNLGYKYIKINNIIYLTMLIFSMIFWLIVAAFSKQGKFKLKSRHSAAGFFKIRNDLVIIAFYVMCMQ